MKTSKLTSKFQTTIPKEIRKTLKTVQGTLAEWESEYDEKAFKHLQGKNYVLGKYDIK